MHRQSLENISSKDEPILVPVSVSMCASACVCVCVHASVCVKFVTGLGKMCIVHTSDFVHDS